VRRSRLFGVAAVLVACLASPGSSVAQPFTQRGFVELRGTWFPQDAPNDLEHLIGDFLVREEAFLTVADWLQAAAAVDVRANSHGQVTRSWRPDFRDRERLRPAFSIRRLSTTLTRGPLTLDAGKQFIRWGKTDILTPTDRFGPRDFLNVVSSGDSEFLPVSGVRLALQVRDDALDVVWVPFFTPSRLPLIDQRWTVVPQSAVPFSLTEAGAAFPARSQGGVRWSHVGSGHEYSVVFFDGFNHLPDIAVRTQMATREVEIARRYPALRMYGGDLAVPTRWVTLKGEAGLFTSTEPESDEYALYVFQVERQTGEWLLTGGYTGEVVVQRRSAANFAPDRGMTRSVIGRASYTIDPNRSAALEGAVRQDGDGVYVKGEYSWLRGQRWRMTLAGVVLAGDAGDFLGQYQRNSHVGLSLRYSF